MRALLPALAVLTSLSAACAAPNSSGCLALDGWWNYRISVPQMPAGTWRVVVRHADSSIDTVFTSSVDVPPSD